jgi:type IV secretion system protein VirD4
MIAQGWALFCRLMFLLAFAFALLGLGLVARRYPTITLLVLVALVWRHGRQVIGSVWSHGSARWGTLSDLLRGRMLGESGIFLGTAELVEPMGKWRAVLALLWPFTRSDHACRNFLAACFGSWWNYNTFIYVYDYVHLAVFAKAGAGKGVSLIVTNLMSCRSSLVIIDIKGELWRITSEHRRRKLRHKVIRLDPLGIAGPVAESMTMNPLDAIDENSDLFLDDCRELAGAFVVRTGKETDPHWPESARLVLTAFIAFVCGCEADRTKRNMNTVRMLVSSRVAFENAITIMQEETDICQGVIARLGGMLTWYVDRELGSVLSTVSRYTEFLDSPAVQRHTATTSFDPRILRSNRASLYCCLPHDKVESLAPLQRMWLSTIIRSITKGELSEKNPVLFILDEAAHMGRVEIIERAVTLLRGAGIRIWFVFQSLGQLKEVYGDKADVMLDNIGTQQYMAVSHYDTAEAISKRIGERTLGIKTLNLSFSKSRSFGVKADEPGSYSVSSSTNYSDMSRRLIRPEEIMVLDESISLLFHRNLPVIPARLIRYYDHPAFCHGGTGRQKPLGLAAGLVAVSLLVLGTGFIGIAASLPQPQSRQVVAMPASRQRVRPSPAPNRRQPPYGWPGRPHPGGVR